MTESNSTDMPDVSSTFEFDSKLTDTRRRFLSCAMEHAFFVGRRTADDFIRYFPPEVIMEGMAQRPELRASILSQTTGLKPKIAAKKSWESAAEDLRIALVEGETNATAVVSVFAPDDRVLYLPQDKIWEFLTEGEFHNVTVSRSADFRVAKQHIAYLLDRALKDKLLTHRDIIEGVGISELSIRLPKAELGKLIESAIVAGREKKPFADAELWGSLTSTSLVEHVPLPQIWANVIVAKIAMAHGFAADAKRAFAAAPKVETPQAAETPAPREEQDWVELPEDNASASDLISEDDFA
jgi:hypothetical protein